MQRAHRRALGDLSLQPHGKREARPGLARRPAQGRAGDRIVGGRARHTRSISPSRKWKFLPSLLDAASRERAFTLENGIWRTIFEVERFGRTFAHADYASQNGFTIRYGDGEFGLPPAEQSVFRVRYRTDVGTIANLPADSVTAIADPSGLSSAPTVGVATGVRNPFAITTGVDPEDAAVVRNWLPRRSRRRHFAPCAMKIIANTRRRSKGCSTPAPGRAGPELADRIRTVDPLNAFSLSDDYAPGRERARLRASGRAEVTSTTHLRNVDLVIRICIEPTAYAGQVVERCAR